MTLARRKYFRAIALDAASDGLHAFGYDHNVSLAQRILQMLSFVQQSFGGG
jgi:hypothetical protein